MNDELPKFTSSASLLRRLIYRIRLWWWGKLTTVERDHMDAWGSHLTTEYEIFDCRGNSIGYWAYGSFDPNAPYQGDKLP